jgi:hypothetical protein
LNLKVPIRCRVALHTEKSYCRVALDFSYLSVSSEIIQK